MTNRTGGEESTGQGEAGFTLLEMIVVMIILGVLAAIAVPMIVSQRGKARDTATRSDTRLLGIAVHDWFLENVAAPTVGIAGDRFVINSEDVGAATPGTVSVGGGGAVVDTTGWTPAAWCLALTNPQGTVRTFRMSAQRGLESGTCTSTVLP